MAVAGWFGWETFRQVDLELHLRAGSLVATGEIVDIHERQDRFDTSYVVVEFTTASGYPVRADVEEYYWRPPPRVGDQPRLRYHPDHPARYVRDVRLEPNWLGVALTAAATLGFAGGAVVVTVRSRSPR